LGCSEHYSLRISNPIKSSLLVEPYGIASRNLEKARVYAKKWGFAKAYGSYEELLADPGIDFVYCPLPNNLHLAYIKKAADAGKPILCEKHSEAPIPIHDAVANMAVLDALYASAASGAWEKVVRY
jgi:predicted dehydrogenase